MADIGEAQRRVTASSETEKPVRVEVGIKRNMTVEQARDLFQALLDLGLVEQEKEG